MKGIFKARVLNRSDKKGCIIIQELSKEEENQIDNSIIKYGVLTYILNNEIVVKDKDIYLYGEIDFNNKEDKKLLNKFKNILCDIDSPGNFIHSNLNYETGIMTSDENYVFKGHQTFNWKKWFKYNYLLIGNPKRIIVYSVPKHLVKYVNFGSRNAKV